MTTNMILRNTEWAEVAKLAFEAQKQRKYYEKLEDAYMAKLKEVSEGKPSMYGSFSYAFIERKGSIDYSLIPELKSVDMEQYRKPPTLVWRLSDDNIII